MTEQINNQLSAFVDDALSGEESELLVRRLCRDEQLRSTLARYSLIGDVLRDENAVFAPTGFSERIVRMVDGDAKQAVAEPVSPARGNRQVMMAVAASIALAAVALLTLPGRAPVDEALPQLAVAPEAMSGTAPDALQVAQTPAPVGQAIAPTPTNTASQERAEPSGSLSFAGARPQAFRAVSYNVPMTVPADRHSPEARARLNSYLVKHLSTTGSRQGLMTYRNVGYATAQEPKR